MDLKLASTWGWVACKLFGAGDARYKLNTLYVEFQNVASPGLPATPPSFSAGDDHLAYYAALSGDRDYLRVALWGEPAVEVADGDESIFGEGEGNVLNFSAMTAGAAGINGVTFSDSVNSVVLGLALVASPDRADRSRDVVFARGYYDVADQIAKEVGKQIGVTWRVPFTV